MTRRAALIIGGGLILIGLLSLISNLFNINLWSLCFPVGLILLGLLLIFRQRIVQIAPDAKFYPFGDLRRPGIWQVKDEEIWIFAGNIRLDLTQAEFPGGDSDHPGLPTIRVYGFVSDLDVRLPADVGVSISSTGFLTSARLMRRKSDQFLSTVKFSSPGYDTAKKKVHLETLFFVLDLDIDQV